MSGCLEAEQGKGLTSLGGETDAMAQLYHMARSNWGQQAGPVLGQRGEGKCRGPLCPDGRGGEPFPQGGPV